MTKPLPDTIVARNSKASVNASEITLREAKINYIRFHFIEKDLSYRKN
ncbi:hypothetical protein [Emticicia agri]|nr:hypothetical protein [Emticicia agri]